MATPLSVNHLARIAQVDAVTYDLAGDLKALVPEMRRGGITNKRRAAPALANIVQETDHLKTLEEYGDEAYFRSFLGGEWNYHGRGYFMNTWEGSYARLSDEFDVDLIDDPRIRGDESDPDRLALNKKLAARAAMWFWTEGNATGKSMNPYADAGNFTAICSLINRGEVVPRGPINGWEMRRYFYNRALSVLPDDLTLSDEEEAVPSEVPQWRENWEIARVYGRNCAAAPILYWFWDGGMLNRSVSGRPASVDGPAPKISEIRRGFCADLLSWMQRRCGLPIPKNRGAGWNYDGGTQAYWLKYRSVMVPFKLSEMRDGDVAYRRFVDGVDEGHIMGSDGGKALQSFARDNLGNPGPDRSFSVAESHDGGYYQYRIPRERFWA